MVVDDLSLSGPDVLCFLDMSLTPAFMQVLHDCRKNKGVLR